MRRVALTVALGMLLVSCSTSAITPSQRAASSTPSAADIDSALTAARDSMFSNHYTAADDAYRALLQRAPASAAAHAQYALFLNYRHRFDGARSEAVKAVSLDPHDGLAAAVLCRVDDWSQLLTDALGAGRKAVQAAPAEPLAHLFLSEALADGGDVGAAQMEIEAAGRLIDQQPSAYLRAERAREQGNLAGDRGDQKGQLTAFQAAHDAQPQWLYRTIELVDAELNAKDTQEARRVLDAAAAQSPDDVETLQVLGEDAFSAGDAAALVTIWTKAVALAPRDPRVLDMAGAMQVAAKQDINAAIADFQAALASDPRDFQAAAYIMAIARYVQHDDARGRAAIAAAIMTAADNTPHGRHPPVPDPDTVWSADAGRALEAVNAARAATGLPPVKLDPHLSSSAESHSYYWLFNNLSPSVADLGIHQESPGLLGYSGRYPWTRGPAFGYSGAHVGEDITHRGEPAGAVADWVNSVFHRFAIMRPDLMTIGYGEGELGALQMEDMEFGFGSSVATAAVVYPGDGQKNVPATFVDNELPDPVPSGKPRITGYPVTVTFQPSASVLVTSFSVTGPDRSALDAYQLSPGGETENSASLLPVVPLRAATAYTAHIVATVNGTVYDHTWSFTTSG
jgi:tetratricopeptide (TPR) repeat protein